MSSLELLARGYLLDLILKILAVSGGGRGSAQTYLPMAKHMGADLTLSKSFVAQDLLEYVQKLIETK